MVGYVTLFGDYLFIPKPNTNIIDAPPSSPNYDSSAAHKSRKYRAIELGSGVGLSAYVSLSLRY